jgi:AraC family transcriptional regulator
VHPAGINPYKTIGQRAVSDLRITHFAQAPGSRIPRHYHENATLCLLLRGSARDFFRHRMIEYMPGAVIYRPPAEEHSHQFGLEKMAAIVIEIPSLRFKGDSELNLSSGILFVQNAPTLGDAAQFLACLGEPHSADVDIEEHCLSLLTVFKHNGAEAFTSDGVRRVQKCLDEDFAGKQSLKELAEMAGLHPAYLVNAFRKRHGCSMGQYRRRRRVALAIRQIWNTESPLSEIALETGFYDQSHCSNEIRRQLRLTPGQVRSMMAGHL